MPLYESINSHIWLSQKPEFDGGQSTRGVYGSPTSGL
ncbi:hypothetical protein SPLC1_S202010 [Arthrospira platensis C1]|nr:hypothetical protein SPLC1_S202010 [Arthrospira platensis C1]